MSGALGFPARSAKIMIIRHGEKPGEPIDAPGVPDDESLTAAGWERARALVNIFHPPVAMPIREGIAVPTALFATSVDDPTSSKRPLETITPLAHSFTPNLDVDTSVKAKKTSEIAAAAAGAGGTVLVAWRHEFILEIAASLAPHAALPQQKWPGSCFDIICVFDKGANGEYEFSQIPELALPTDTSALLS